jgi:hypothetical protein
MAIKDVVGSYATKLDKKLALGDYDDISKFDDII